MIVFRIGAARNMIDIDAPSTNKESEEEDNSEVKFDLVIVEKSLLLVS